MPTVDVEDGLTLLRARAYRLPTGTTSEVREAGSVAMDGARIVEELERGGATEDMALRLASWVEALGAS